MSPHKSWLTMRSARELVRYYQAAVVNTAFGYGLYACFIAVGLNIYVAQLVAHVMGVTFNYFTYSRHAFRETEGSKLRFVLTYVLNYFVGLTILALSSLVMDSPYLVGLSALIIGSLINYVLLKHVVFTKARAGEAL